MRALLVANRPSDGMIQRAVGWSAAVAWLTSGAEPPNVVARNVNVALTAPAPVCSRARAAADRWTVTRALRTPGWA